MRKENFLKAIDLQYDKLVKRLHLAGADLHQAEDAVQDALCSVLANKSYTSIDSEKVAVAAAFLNGAVWNKFRTNWKRDLSHQRVVTNIEELDTQIEDPFDRTDFRDRAKDPDTCPFCHKEITRTMYNDIACPHCGTVVGAGTAYTENVGVTDDELLADVPDLDMLIDVQSAMKKLTPIEREIMEAFSLRHTSLDDMSLLYDMDRFSLRRIFLRAKDKLKKELEAYETV